MADPFAFGQHEDLPWRLPEALPPKEDLAIAKASLERQMSVVDRKHAAYCLSKLAVAFNAKWAKDEAEAQLAVWIEANGDLPNDLWSSATIALVQTHVYGMPKPVHLRAIVVAQFNARKVKLNRVQSMIGEGGKPAKRAIREPVEVRLRSAVWLGWKYGKMPMAVAAERELARLENRAPARWCVEPVETPRPAPDAPVSRPDSAATRAALLPSRIRYWAAQLGKSSPVVTALVADLAALNGSAPGDQFEPTGELV